MNIPDNWVVIKVTNEEETFYKILVGWSGSYLSEDSWRLNSGIERIEKAGEYYNIHGASGSVYSCHKDLYCLRMNTMGAWTMMQEKHPESLTLLDDRDDWTTLVLTGE